MKFIVSDLSAIENRVLGWMAGCDPILDVFRRGEDTYLAMAALMYGVPYESLIKIVDGKHKPKDADAEAKRQIGKPAVLGPGYGLGDGTDCICSKCKTKSPSWMWKCPECGRKPLEGTRVARLKQDRWGNEVKDGLIAYAENMGIKLAPEDSYLAVKTFRNTYSEVVQLWSDMENAAKDAIITGSKVPCSVVEFSTVQIGKVPVLRMLLPSGRYLHYWNVRLDPKDRFGNPSDKASIVYDGIGHGVGAMSDKVIWERVYTYGGKIVENADQAISRDILIHGMTLAEEAGMEVVFHVHDEIGVLAADDSWFGLENLQWAMSETPAWADGLLLAAEGFEGRVYRKS